jgi:transposase
MRSRRTYKRVAVKNVNLEALWSQAVESGGRGTSVGFDIAKEEIVVMVRWPDGSYEHGWSVKNPSEIGLLITILCELRERCDGLRVAMESTGTYGEALRYAATAAKLDLHRVSGKGVADYREIFDGVPSQHDSKDAAMIAELAAYGKGTPWPYCEKPEIEQLLVHQVAKIEAFRHQVTAWKGRMEALLARHWPELTKLLGLNTKTIIHLLEYFGSPANVAASPEAVKKIRQWSRRVIPLERIDEILQSAKTTQGIPMNSSETAWMQDVATQMREANQVITECEAEIKTLAKNDEEIQRLSALGIPTMCVIRVKVGSAKEYGSAGAFVKALGLNLKELSSGKRKGELAITRRGPAIARRWLYFAALRAMKTPEVGSWAKRKHERDNSHGKMKALIGIMRKLARSIWHVTNTGEEFDWAKVFPGKPIVEKVNHG